MPATKKKFWVILTTAFIIDYLVFYRFISMQYRTLVIVYSLTNLFILKLAPTPFNPTQHGLKKWLAHKLSQIINLFSKALRWRPLYGFHHFPINVHSMSNKKRLSLSFQTFIVRRNEPLWWKLCWGLTMQTAEASGALGLGLWPLYCVVISEL